MIITKNKMVSLTYDLRLDGAAGEVIEQATIERPLTFIFGNGMMLPALESELEGMEQGKPFEVKLCCKDAYGELNEEGIIDLPRDIFVVNGVFDNKLVKVGNTIPMASSSGERLNGIVLEVTDKTVKMDFNHPLAGEDLYFKGEIIEVRDASDEEIAAITSGCSCHSHGCDCDSEHDCDCDDCGDEPGCGCGCNH